MSWPERIKQPFVITTGDGKVFTPLWKSGETSKEFNAATFEFINLPGSLIDRKEVKARKFPLTFWFQGTDNIEQADAFDRSTNDPRAWKLQHPFYGTIIGQPLSINRNDNTYNATEITVDFWETITGNILPKAVVSMPDVTNGLFDVFTGASAIEYAAKADLKPADVSQVNSLAQKINAQITKVLTAVNYNDYQLAANAMFAAINNMILAPAPAITSIHNVIRQPALFELAVKTRITLMSAIIGSIADLLKNKPTANNKAFYESTAGAAISTMALAMVNPQPGDYNTRNDIAAASLSLSGIYTNYLQALDGAYVPVNDPLNGFSAGNGTQTQLQSLVISTISNLNTLAFSAKQERITTLDKDSNLIVLTHKYMGLDAPDANLETFRTLNNIRNKELFLIKKGRLIKYLV